MNFSSFFIFEVRIDTNILIFLLCVHTEKERIDSGYFIFQAAQKRKKKRRVRKKEKKIKTSSAALGAMFEKDSCTNESSFSSDSSDEDFIITQKRKRG